ncbi:AbrB/MazE/SpoVT family DNA-binding domain-containing protein [Aquifex sp.]
MVSDYPKKVLEELDLKGEDTFELQVESGKIVLIPKKKYTLEDLVSQISPENLHTEVDWGRNLGKEEW